MQLAVPQVQLTESRKSSSADKPGLLSDSWPHKAQGQDSPATAIGLQQLPGRSLLGCQATPSTYSRDSCSLETSFILQSR